jgi:hypothetical protein
LNANVNPKNQNQNVNVGGNNMQEKLKGVKEIIDAEAYSGGILNRDKKAAMSEDSKDTLKAITIASRRKKIRKSKIKRCGCKK